MKKTIFLLLAAVFVAVPALAQWSPSPDSRGVTTAPLTSSGVVTSSPASITQIVAETDGTNNLTIAVYNNTAGSGEKVTEFTCIGSALTCGVDWKTPRFCGNGIYITITTTGTAKVFPEYQPR